MLSASVVIVMCISVISLEAPMIQSSGMPHSEMASVNLSGSITVALVGDILRLSPARFMGPL